MHTFPDLTFSFKKIYFIQASQEECGNINEYLLIKEKCMKQYILYIPIVLM